MLSHALRYKRCIFFPGTVLFFCLFRFATFAATPSVETFSPSSGESSPDQELTFTSVISDSGGWQSIRHTQLLFTATASPVNAFRGYYFRDSNKLYLANDASDQWLGGYAPGSQNVIENSYASLNCAKTVVSGSGNRLTITWGVSFKPSFVGSEPKIIYLKARDNTDLDSGWAKSGSWKVRDPPGRFAPEVGILNPTHGSSAPDQAVSFTTTFVDKDGWKNLREVVFIIESAETKGPGIWINYNLEDNEIYLWDGSSDISDKHPPGTSHIIENRYLKLDCAKTSVSGNGDTLTVNWNFSFKATLSSQQVKIIELYAQDKDDFDSYWGQMGTWLVGGSNLAPKAGTMSISGATDNTMIAPGTPVIFNTTFTDPNGGADIRDARLLVNVLPDEKSCFYGYFDFSANKLYLRDDAGTSWLGGFEPESNNFIENSRAKLDCSRSEVYEKDGVLYIDWAVTFKPAFAGRRNIYLYVQDASGAYDGWANKGYCVINYPLRIISLSPPDRSGFISPGEIKIKAAVFNPDNDSLRYRYFLDGRVIKDWSDAAEYIFRAGIEHKGRHNIKVEAEDGFGASDTEDTDIYIYRNFPYPSER